MTNHVHFVAVPYSETSLARGFGEAHRRYTRMKNFTQGVRRYLFQGRFSSRVFDRKYLLAAVRYVQLNPVRARYDGPLLKAVLQAGYRPKVLQLEVNPEFPPPIEFAVHDHPEYRAIDDAGNFSGFYGASLAYICAIAQPYKYSCVYLDFDTDWTHDVTLVHEDFFEVAIALFGEDICTKTLREFYLEHPPGYSHFAEYEIDSSAWRYLTDDHILLKKIWVACMQANIRKHSHPSVPFHLSC